MESENHYAKRLNISAAIRAICSDAVNIPDKQRSRYLCLIHEGFHLPPKFVWQLAIANMKKSPKPPQSYNATSHKDKLHRLGFLISACRCRNTISPAPLICRLVVDGKAYFPPEQAKTHLLEFFRRNMRFPKRPLVTITPGGFIFIKRKLPNDIGQGWNTPHDSWQMVCRIAHEALDEILTKKLVNHAKKHSHYLTLGIDINTPRDSKPHAELVATINLDNGTRCLTGKSYPSLNQERNLIRCPDLTSHFQILGNYKVLILGCHDLTIFNPRAAATTVKRERRTLRMRFAAQCHRFKPHIILQHPHTTDTPNTWRQSWSIARQCLKSPTHGLFASGISYHRKGGSKRSSFDSVLKHTKSLTNFTIYDEIL